MLGRMGPWVCLCGAPRSFRGRRGDAESKGTRGVISGIAVILLTFDLSVLQGIWCALSGGFF